MDGLSISGIDGALASYTASAVRENQFKEIAASAPKDAGALDRAAKEFEGMFLAQMLGQMFSEVKLGSAFGEESSEGEVYQSFLINEYGKLIANSGGIGVADYVKREMLRLQEVAP